MILHRLASAALRAAMFLVCLVPLGLQAQVLIVYSTGPKDARPSHDSPAHIAKNIVLIESRPFDGMVINDYLGRNLMNVDLKADAPKLVAPPEK